MCYSVTYSSLQQTKNCEKLRFYFVSFAKCSGITFATFLSSTEYEDVHCISVQLTGTINDPASDFAITTPRLFSAVVRR